MWAEQSWISGSDRFVLALSHVSAKSRNMDHLNAFSNLDWFSSRRLSEQWEFPDPILTAQIQLQWLDILVYLVEKPSFYTKEKLKAYKCLVPCHHVEDINTEIRSLCVMTDVLTTSSVMTLFNMCLYAYGSLCLVIVYSKCHITDIISPYARLRLVFPIVK